MSPRTVLRPAAVVCVALTASAALGVAPASAKALFTETFEGSFTFVDDNFCDTGMTILLDGDYKGRAAVHLRQGLPYYRGVRSGVTRFTNPETGVTVTETYNTLERDMNVTVNGDGTYTLLVMGTGNSTTADSDGKAIARNPGQIRFELLISDAGTPDDFSDDEFLEDLGVVRESTGRSDDFCEAAVRALS